MSAVYEPAQGTTRLVKAGAAKWSGRKAVIEHVLFCVRSVAIHSIFIIAADREGKKKKWRSGGVATSHERAMGKSMKYDDLFACCIGRL